LQTLGAVSRVSITNAKSIINEPFSAILTQWKKLSTFFQRKKADIENKKKQFKKIILPPRFFNRRFSWRRIKFAEF
jgi:hypothetical protein